MASSPCTHSYWSWLTITYISQRLREFSSILAYRILTSSSRLSLRLTACMARRTNTLKPHITATLICHSLNLSSSNRPPNLLHAHTHTYIHAHTRTHTYTHTHAHTHTHTHTHRLTPSDLRLRAW